jgi:endonuclease/exonuclease/phosphatase family metal-dependent hydrolase
MKKIIKRLILAVLCIILAVILIMGANLFFYYPRYTKNKKPVTFTEKPVEADNITVMSSNLRCINPGDKGKRSWFYRADLIIKNIESCEPSIIGLQEATPWQYEYMKDCLAGFDSVIEFRDEAVNTEGCPVFYRSDTYNLIDKGSFWLSETPEKMSKDWGAACYRICSYVILEEKATGKQFVVFNTHLDHVSDEARIKGIGVVLDKIKQFGSLPSIIMGDFNTEEDTVTYQNVTKDFLDAKYQTENTMKGCTYQAFGERLDDENIDYFMISKTGITVDEYKVITTTYDGVYPSDHFPILMKFRLGE